MKKIYLITAILITFSSIYSCTIDRTDYVAGNRTDVSFPSPIANYSMLTEDGNKIQIELWRGNTKGALSVPVTITDGTNGVFVPEKRQFDFADGENKAYLKFTYQDINKFGGEKYSINVRLTDSSMVSYSGNHSLQITAQRKLTFQKIGDGQFSSEFFEDAWTQEVQKAKEADYYRLPDCYYKGYPIEFSISSGKITFAKQPMGYISSTYGMTYWVPKNLDLCTINGKTLTFVVDFRVSAGSFGLCKEILVMP